MIRMICIILALICMFQPEADTVSGIFWVLVAIFFQIYKNGRTV